MTKITTAPHITLRKITTSEFEDAQMREIPLKLELPAGHPALDGTRSNPVYVTITTADGDEFNGYAVDTWLGMTGNLITRVEIS